jgi:hypothetical protein
LLGSRLSLANVMDSVRAELDRYGIGDVLGAGAYFETVDLALEAYTQSADSY